MRTDTKWVMYKLLAITKRVARGYSFGFAIKISGPPGGQLVFFMSRPEHPSFPATRLRVSSNSYNHTVFGRMRLKKLQPI